MAEQRQLTALLVGHDKDSADLLGTMLESVGLNVQTALNEEQAYQMLTNNPDTLFVEPIGIRGGKPYLYPFLEDLVKKEVKKPNFIITAGVAATDKLAEAITYSLQSQPEKLQKGLGLSQLSKEEVYKLIEGKSNQEDYDVFGTTIIKPAGHKIIIPKVEKVLQILNSNAYQS